MMIMLSPIDIYALGHFASRQALEIDVTYGVRFI